MRRLINQEEKHDMLTIERAKELKNYYASLCVYITFCLFFFILNSITYKGKWWFYWPMLVWGLIVVLQTIKVFIFNKDWEQANAEKIVAIGCKQDDERNEYYQALKRVKELKNYYTSIATYFVFSLFFFIINYRTSYGQWWFYWPIFGWGLGVVVHTMRTFALGKKWEERKIQEILEKNKQQAKKWD